MPSIKNSMPSENRNTPMRSTLLSWEGEPAKQIKGNCQADCNPNGNEELTLQQTELQDEVCVAQFECKADFNRPAPPSHCSTSPAAASCSTIRGRPRTTQEQREGRENPSITAVVREGACGGPCQSRTYQRTSAEKDATPWRP